MRAADSCALRVCGSVDMPKGRAAALARNDASVSMRLHREAHGPHHHVGIFRIDILIDNDDHFVGRISARGGLERLPGFPR